MRSENWVEPAAVITTGMFSSSWYACGNNLGRNTNPSSWSKEYPPYAAPIWKPPALGFSCSFALDETTSRQYIRMANSMQAKNAFKRTRITSDRIALSLSVISFPVVSTSQSSVEKWAIIEILSNCCSFQSTKDPEPQKKTKVNICSCTAIAILHRGHTAKSRNCSCFSLLLCQKPQWSFHSKWSRVISHKISR